MSKETPINSEESIDNILVSSRKNSVEAKNQEYIDKANKKLMNFVFDSNARKRESEPFGSKIVDVRKSKNFLS